VVEFGEWMMILELARQGLTVAAIAREMGHDRKTVRKYIERGLEPPAYKPRAAAPSSLAPFTPYLRERLRDYPTLTAKRLWRELCDRGFEGGYSSVTRVVRGIRPPVEVPFERRFETPAGRQAQVDFAFFKATFEDEPEVERVVWLFSMVLGHSRWLWGRFVARQDLATVLRCHVAAFASLGGVPEQILYDRMKTAVLGEADERGIVYHPKLIALAKHYGFAPKACRPYRAQTKGKVERPYRYVREDFFLGRRFRNLDDLNAQFDQWLDQIANRRRHGTTGRIVLEHFVEEKPALGALPAGRFDDVLALERRISKDGMVSVGGNLYSVPDGTRRRHPVEVHLTVGEVHILDGGRRIATHPILEGRGQRRIAAGHRTLPPPSNSTTPRADAAAAPSAERVIPRSLAIYDTVGRALAARAVTP
jgi:transposase